MNIDKDEKAQESLKHSAGQLETKINSAGVYKHQSCGSNKPVYESIFIFQNMYSSTYNIFTTDQKHPLNQIKDGRNITSVHHL